MPYNIGQCISQISESRKIHIDEKKTNPLLKLFLPMQELNDRKETVQGLTGPLD